MYNYKTFLKKIKLEEIGVNNKYFNYGLSHYMCKNITYNNNN